MFSSIILLVEMRPLPCSPEVLELVMDKERRKEDPRHFLWSPDVVQDIDEAPNGAPDEKV